jgi:iron complex transport system substrate-binding protein
LNPDLVCVAPFNSADFLKLMERSGLPVYRNEASHRIDEIEQGILDLGQRVGEPAKAAALVGRMREQRRQLGEKLKDVKHRPRVLYWSAGFTAGLNTTMDDIIREAGGINIATEKEFTGNVPISAEQVITADPEILLLSRWSADDGARQVQNHPPFRQLSAVRNNRIVVIDGKYLTSVSHHVVSGIERLAQALHPEIFQPSGAP